jgi:metal-sulfur cluster biosynthetic enzyme
VTTPTVEKPAEGAQPAPAGNSALPEAEITWLIDEIVTALKTVYDPEIPADIYEIGLIYRIDIADDRTVKVDMSLTSPNCPSAAAFGDALIWGLEQQFGAAFTPEMKEAWIKLYDDVQREMMRAGGTSEDAGSVPASR